MSYLSKIAADEIENGLSSGVALTCVRGSYSEILSMTGPGACTPKELLKRYADALPELGIESITLTGRAKRLHGKRGFIAVNASLFGYDPVQKVAVYQLRQTESGRYGKEVRKTYVLAGFNESGTAFRHPISAACVHGAVKSVGNDPAYVVKKAQCWMWECTQRQLTEALHTGCRQGDVLMAKVGEPKSAVRMENRVLVLGESHEIRASQLREDEKSETRIYALNPLIVHTKGQHEPVIADSDCWYSVRLARTESAWRFGQRLGD